MGKNHVFVIARDFKTRLRVPCCVRKYGAKKAYGAENVYPTREACASAIIQDEVFEYQTRAGETLLLKLSDIREQCKMLGSDEVNKDEFDIMLKRSDLTRKDFTRVLDMGDVLVSNFNMFFWICDCGTNELWVREADCRVINRIDAIHSIGPMSSYLQPPYSGGPLFDVDKLVISADFATEGDTTNFSLFKQHSNGAFELLPPGEFPIDLPKVNKLFPMHFAHVGDAEWSQYPFKVADEAWQQFQKEYLNVPPVHDDKACQALAEYDAMAGDAHNTAYLMRQIAEKYDTTIEEMKKHWRCLERQS